MANMQKNPNIPAQAVFDQIETQIARQDRGVFATMLADALGVKPSRTAWRSFGKKNPDRYVKAVGELARLNGYADKTEKHIYRHDPKSLALELVNRLGEDKARSVLTNFGLPATLIPSDTQMPEVIDGETD